MKRVTGAIRAEQDGDGNIPFVGSTLSSQELQNLSEARWLAGLEDRRDHFVDRLVENSNSAIVMPEVLGVQGLSGVKSDAFNEGEREIYTNRRGASDPAQSKQDHLAFSGSQSAMGEGNDEFDALLSEMDEELGLIGEGAKATKDQRADIVKDKIAHEMQGRGHDEEKAKEKGMGVKDKIKQEARAFDMIRSHYVNKGMSVEEAENIAARTIEEHRRRTLGEATEGDPTGITNVYAQKSMFESKPAITFTDRRGVELGTYFILNNGQLREARRGAEAPRATLSRLHESIHTHNQGVGQRIEEARKMAEKKAIAEAVSSFLKPLMKG